MRRPIFLFSKQNTVSCFVEGKIVYLAKFPKTGAEKNTRRVSGASCAFENLLIHKPGLLLRQYVGGFVAIQRSEGLRPGSHLSAARLRRIAAHFPRSKFATPKASPRTPTCESTAAIIAVATISLALRAGSRTGC